MRWQSGITPDMRVLFGGRVLKVEAVINYGERRTDLQLMCQEAAT
jgi:head-tail adaptor